MLRPGLRFEIFKRDSFTCRYCGRKSPEAILEIDHAIPRSMGGGDESDNLVTSCFECNRGKGSRLLSSPSTEDLHEKAIQIAEHELQVAEYNHWLAKAKTREDTELAELERIWVGRWGARYWSNVDVRPFLRCLGYHALLEILEIVDGKTTLQGSSGWAHSAWKFFMGICNHRRRDGGV